MILVPDAGGLFSTWKNQDQFTYRGHVLELDYRTEPPHGDFIYSLTLLTGRTRYRLPLWIFGRSLFFFGSSFLLAEGVQAGSLSSIKSVVVDLSGARYACLDGWYRKPQLTGQGLRLVRVRDSAPLLLSPSSPLTWNKFYCDGDRI